MFRRAFFLWPAILIGASSLASPQASTYGRLIGVARDAQGGVLPGVTVTLSGPAIIGDRPTTTDVDGSYRFQALPPGTYNVRFEMTGFKTLSREGLIITTGTTITIDATLELAAVAETVTVTGESPVVDVKSTRMGATFDLSALQDVPSATDVWAVLAQAPGIRMRGYDVGGSHKSQQTPYESFGIRNQNRVLSDGVDSTEGTGGTGFYYDYYSAEEFQVSAAGGDVEMTSPGTAVVMTIKSGGNQFSGLYHIDYEGEDFVSDNIDSELAQRGYTGNPNLLFWEGHADLGGPFIKDKFWFYGSYNHFKIDKEISGVDPNQTIGGIATTDLGLFDNYAGKLTHQLSQKDQIIAYSQWGRKQKPNRELSLTTPPESVLAQDSWSWVHKAEWQRVWSDRAFSNIQLKHFGFIWPMVPKVDPKEKPSRIDTATGINSGAGFQGTATPPFTFRRWKPQVTAQLNYYIPAKAGSHDFKFGFDWQIDSSQFNFNNNSGSIRYFDNSDLGRPNNADEVRFVNTPTNGNDNRDQHTDFFAQDTWTLSNRVTLNLGFRFGRQSAYFPDSELMPERTEFFPSGPSAGKTLVIWNNVAPRIGATVDLTGRGKTVLKGYYGRYYVNIADTLSGANPAGVQFVQFQFLDQNQNGIYDGQQELGTLVSRSSAGGGTPVNPDLEPSYADEFSFSVEHELVTDTGFRFSYVRKQLRNDFPSTPWNRAQVLPLLDGRGIPCGDAVFPCPLDPFTNQPLNLMRVPSEFANAQDPIIDTYPAGFSDYDYDTIQFAVNRRFTKNFFVQGNFDYQWRDESRSADGESRSPLVADPLAVLFFQNHSLDASNRQTNTNWQGKILGRYVFPADIGVSVNLRYQSGWPWAPIHRLSIPGSGTRPIFLQDIEENRSESVTILDVRVEKIFKVRDRHRITAMVDFYNLTNGNAETNFVLRTGRSFRNIIAALDPRAVKIGVRYQF